MPGGLTFDLFGLSASFLPPTNVTGLFVVPPLLYFLKIISTQPLETAKCFLYRLTSSNLYFRQMKLPSSLSCTLQYITVYFEYSLIQIMDIKTFRATAVSF